MSSDFSKDNRNKTVDDSFQAFLVDGAQFTGGEEYPIIRPDMIPNEFPLRIMPFSKAIKYQGDLSHTYICTFSPDKTFERVRRNPKRYLNFYKRTAGIIGFDFSIHTDMPIIKQKSQINDNLSLTFYYGNNGILTIPNLRCGVDELLDEYFNAIPDNSLVAISPHGFIKEKHEQYEWYCFIEKVLDKLNPSGILVHGHLSSKIFDDFKNQAKFVFYEPWIYTKDEEVQKNVN